VTTASIPSENLIVDTGSALTVAKDRRPKTRSFVVAAPFAGIDAGLSYIPLLGGVSRHQEFLFGGELSTSASHRRSTITPARRDTVGVVLGCWGFQRILSVWRRRESGRPKEPAELANESQINFVLAQGFCLCDDMKSVIADVASKIPIEVEVIDVDRADELRKFGNEFSAVHRR